MEMHCPTTARALFSQQALHRQQPRARLSRVSSVMKNKCMRSGQDGGAFEHASRYTHLLQTTWRAACGACCNYLLYFVRVRLRRRRCALKTRTVCILSRWARRRAAEAAAAAARWQCVTVHLCTRVVSTAVVAPARVSTVCQMRRVRRRSRGCAFGVVVSNVHRIERVARMAAASEERIECGTTWYATPIKFKTLRHHYKRRLVRCCLS